MKSTNLANLMRLSIVVTALGATFLFSPTTRALTPLPDGGYAGNNTAEGSDALFHNTTGINNAAVGFGALFNNSSGSYNKADGAFALFSNTSGVFNTAAGFQALLSNQSGVQNTAIGAGALVHNVIGRTNIAVGFLSGYNTNGSANILIGNVGVGNENRAIRIGTNGVHVKTFIAGVSTSVAGNAVCVNGNGQVGTCAPSAERFKHNIGSMDKVSEVIFGLRPVTFRYNEELDPRQAQQFGLIAEDVVKASPDLVRYNEEGKLTGVRYEAVNAMLLNEFLKEHQRVQEQTAKIAEQEREIKTLTASLKHQAAQIERVSAEIALIKGKRQLVSRDQ